MADKMKDRYAFIAEWYDVNASLIRRYQLLFFTTDETMEMFDMKNKRLFLKRSTVDNVKLKDLFLGATVNIFSRHLTIVDYGDEFTRKTFGSENEKTLAMIKPDSDKIGEIVDRVISEGFTICNARLAKLTRDDAAVLYAEHEGKEFFERLLNLLGEGPVFAMSITAQGAVKRWREVLGPTDPVDARRDFPSSIRAQYGTNVTRNACHGSDSLKSAAREVDLFFGPKNAIGKRAAKLGGSCTLGIIKPHAVRDKLSGKIIQAITQSGAGLQISGLELRCVDKVNAEEFYEVYKGVVNEYSGMVEELTLGPCITMEITGDNAHSKFRELTGPADPEIARHLRPHTLRAKFGIDKIKNAVHCTDLPEDGPLEVQYFFSVLK
jgi:nucleoside-diphosphate kinase